MPDAASSTACPDGVTARMRPLSSSGTTSSPAWAPKLGGAMAKPPSKAGSPWATVVTPPRQSIAATTVPSPWAAGPATSRRWPKPPPVSKTIPESVFVAGTEAKAPARPSGETRITPGTVPRSRTKRSPPAKRHPAPESWSPGESAMYASGPSLPR